MTKASMRAAVDVRIKSLRDTSLKSWSLLAQEKSRLLRDYAPENADEERNAVFAARQLRYMLQHLPVAIGEGELIVGHIPSRTPTAEELRRSQVGGDTLASRAPNWVGKKRFLPPEVFALFETNVLHPAGNHQVVSFHKVLSVGIAGILEEIEAASKSLS